MPFAHSLPYDPTYGYSREELLALKPPEIEPVDFDPFWKKTYEEARNVPLSAEMGEHKTSQSGQPYQEVFFDTLGKFRVGGWLYFPKIPTPQAMIVHAHGYGGPGDPGFEEDGAIHLTVHAPGFSLSSHPDLPNESAKHVIHGISSKETYLIRTCVAALWSAATFLLENFPSLKDKLFFQGVSFGGGLGALTLAWENRFVRSQLVVPTFGHHPIRLQCQCGGSGEAVRQLHALRPEISAVLGYFDAATAAKRIRHPVLVAPALFDPAVPPPGQFAVANAIPSKERFVLQGGHFQYPDEAKEYLALDQRTREWFSLLTPRSA